MFAFTGMLSASKSLLHRLSIISAYAAPETFLIHGHSPCDDVFFLQQGLQALREKKPIECGYAAAVFRFLALTASRIPGSHTLTGAPRLFERPQNTLIEVLQQLGVAAWFEDGRLRLESKGWQRPLAPMVVHRSSSSQFASAALLNAWNLPFLLELTFTGESVSDAYWRLTIDCVRRCGMQFQEKRSGAILVPAHQAVYPGTYSAEMDMSSAYALAAVAAVAGRAEIQQYPKTSAQPDAVFPTLLRELGVPLAFAKDVLTIEKAHAFIPVEWNMRACPDLFPMTAVLCALAQGTSHLHGAPQLRHKESDRIKKTAELVESMGATVSLQDDGLRITGYGWPKELKAHVFDPDQDHRMAMAAAVANAAGCRLKILHPEMVRKSFPEFWDIVGEALKDRT